MENQHRKITGYRELSQDEINLMNEIKAQGERLRALLHGLRSTPDVDQRCVSIAYTHLETGIMYAVRAVARPESF